MIIDSITNTFLYETIHPLFKDAFTYLRNTNFDELKFGKHPIDGENLFVIIMEYDTKAKEECLLENHKKYIDIQCMLKGEELIGIKTYQTEEPQIPYDEKNDIAFFDSKSESLIKLKEQHFAIFYPHDLHMPCMSVDGVTTVKKAVFKVRVRF